VRIFVINPGAGSTKIALFDDEERIWEEKIVHPPKELARFERTIDQLEMRRSLVVTKMKEMGIVIEELNAIVARGGPFRPLESGTYLIDRTLVEDILNGRVQADHASNLGALIAYELTKGTDIPAFFVDPVSIDEFEEVARISGLPEIPRVSLAHALNIKMVVRKAAKYLKKDYRRLTFIVAHLGTGISIGIHKNGRLIDVNNANDGGPMSPQRTGTLPVTGLVKLCYSGRYNLREMLNRITKSGGLMAHLGTDSISEIEARIDSGDEKAKLVYEAMIYQIAKEIGAMSTGTKGLVDAIIITGGMAFSERLVARIREYVSFIAPILVYPGENEMEALALGALRVLRNEEKPKNYISY